MEIENSSDYELASWVLEVAVINWANYIGVKNVQYIKMDHASRIKLIESKSWVFENTVRDRK